MFRGCYKAASLLILLAFAVEVNAQSLLLFPRVISSPEVYTGVAISNPTSETASVTFTAYLPDGSRLSGIGVTNPVTVALPGGSQYARLFTEIFNTPDPLMVGLTVSKQDERCSRVLSER